MNREEASKELATLPQVHVREIAHPEGRRRGFQVSDTGVVYRLAREYQVTQEGVRAAAEYLRIPAGYLERCPPELAVMQLNHFMAEKGRVKIVVKEQEVISFLAPKTTPMPPDKVLDSVCRVIGEDEVDFRQVTPKMERSEIYAVGPRQTDVVPGDAVCAGLMVAFSPLGITKPVVEGYIERLVCRNGMTATDFIFCYTGGTGHGNGHGRGGNGNGNGMWQWLHHALRKGYNSLDKTAEQLRLLAATPIEGNVSAALEGFYRHVHIPSQVQEMVNNRVLDEGARTLWDLVNHLTYVASHQIGDPAQRHRLMTAAGEVSSHHQRCTTCHQLLPS